MNQTARSIALDALLQMEDNEGYSNLVLDKTLRSASLEPRDAALASTIFYGVLEKRILLDHYLMNCLTNPRKKLDGTVLMALRCGAYQILFLDRVPDSAAVNETVNDLKSRGKGSYAGLVNGVLRTLSRKKGNISVPSGDSTEALSLRYSVPERLIRMWTAAYGKTVTEKLLVSFDELAETYIRINTLKTTPQALSERLKLEPFDFPAASAKLDFRGSPAGLPEFEDGLFHVQDLSAQLVCEIVAARPEENILDCCAAPGGKTFTLAQQMNGTGAVYAADLYKGRVKLIAAGAARLGIKNVHPLMADATESFNDLPLMDRVLCDVPCSGFGVIRRKPEIRYKNFSEIEKLPALQYAILHNASRQVRSGGRLVYATCTLNPKENGEVVQRFLSENPDFMPLPIELPGIDRIIEEPENEFTMMPFAGASDGFFAAAFIKK